VQLITSRLLRSTVARSCTSTGASHRAKEAKKRPAAEKALKSNETRPQRAASPASRSLAAWRPALAVLAIAVTTRGCLISPDKDYPVGGGSAGEVVADSGAGNDGGQSPAGTAGRGGGGGNGGTGGAESKGGSGGSAGSSGSGGSGGAPPIAKCADHPIPVKSTWVATASISSLGTGAFYDPPAQMTDGLYTTFWSSGKAQSGDEWIQIDFGVVVNLTKLTLNIDGTPNDYPHTYAVRISNETGDFAAEVKASGDGAPGNTVVNFPAPVTGRYLTVRQTGMNIGPPNAWWSITEVLVDCSDR
jgi:hypothetical protein